MQLILNENRLCNTLANLVGIHVKMFKGEINKRLKITLPPKIKSLRYRL